MALAVALLWSCSTSPPRDISNSCEIFDDKSGWYKDAQRAYEHWGVPIHVQLAIIYQESRFEAKAKPPRKRILGFIPGPRPSTAYGYAQALTSTWDVYVSETGNWSARRSSFADAADFVGWYTARTARSHRLSKNDAYNLYLAYHEGDGGFRRGAPFALKPAVDAACGGTNVEHVVVVKRSGGECAMHPGRDHWWHDVMATAGIVLVVLAFFLKAAIVPFHAWAPDAYEGASLPVTAYMATIIKAGVLLAALRLFGTAPMSGPMIGIIAILPLVSIVWGNLTAMRQTSFRRMIAYSSIAHAGYLFYAFLGDGPGRLGVFGITVVAFFLAEMGDKTQIATVALAAKYDALVAVVMGTTIGMMIANVPAVLLGNVAAEKLPVKLVHGIAAAIFAVIGLAMLLGLQLGL